MTVLGWIPSQDEMTKLDAVEAMATLEALRMRMSPCSVRMWG